MLCDALGDLTRFIDGVGGLNYGSLLVDGLVKASCLGCVDLFRSASNMAENRDPLAIDLGTEGIVLTTVDDGVYFDMEYFLEPFLENINDIFS